ncbi:MAG: 3-phosphoshikimate 1-carboxyvinyltransferase [Casimicrobiaceae bacterium]|nr:3-phosphoshikimate 1-carboxyvinyltransferase [Casimicrobiaceae bacterium]
MDCLHLPPVRELRGSVRLPGSKSISNRALLLAALAEGATELSGLLDSDDTRVMRAALERIGVALRPLGPEAFEVIGTGGQLPVAQAELFVGNAGTAARSLVATLALLAQPGARYTVDGVPRMRERPIGDLVSALGAVGARISYLGRAGYPPLAIEGGSIALEGPIPIRGEVSSQFLTGLLLALPPVTARVGREAEVRLEGELISKPYVEMTLSMMAAFGVRVEREGWQRFLVPPHGYRSPGAYAVEGDASSASYFLAAGALAGGPVRVEGVGQGALQGDVAFVDALEAMGARITRERHALSAMAPADGRLRAVDLDLNAIPDAAMTLAVLALFAAGPSRLRGIGSWRVKETDRIAAMATELRKLGARVEEGAHELRITPPERLVSGAQIDTYDDHRMAMCFSLVSLGARGVPVTIRDPGCVAKTFPDYFRVFAALTGAHAHPGA